MSLRCVRLYSDSAGESHFEDADIVLSTMDFAPPAPPLDVSTIASARHGFLRAASGWYGDWHPAPRRQMMSVLSGELELHASDGTSRQLGPGAIFLLEDTDGKGHRTRVTSAEPAVLMFAQLN